MADTRVADESCFDNALLALEIADLSALNFNVELTGFDADELMAISAVGNATSDGLTEDDAAPRMPTFPVKKQHGVEIDIHRPFATRSKIRRVSLPN